MNMHDKMTRVDAIMGMAPVIAVVVLHDASRAPGLARALVAGGIPVVEITLRTPAALDAARAAAAEVPEAVVGVGTVRSGADLDAALAAGAAFAVSPGAGPRLLDAAAEHPLPLLPGAVTPSEVMGLAERGYTRQKFFPAAAMGGPPVLKAFASPLPDVQFCPTGGVRPDTARGWLSLPNVRCVGGSWVAPRDAIAAGDWPRITALAAAAARLGAGR
jgi:2-dehydro-3-deoxyphosphogluconate aldolase / (4S)-4-hydroxy-2-oxoglutarate aldolase